MFNFRPKTDLPGFRVGQAEDVPGFALDPNGLPSGALAITGGGLYPTTYPAYDPTAPVGDGSPPAQAPRTAPSAVVPVAAGDLACEGMRGGCESGGDWGSTAAYRVEGRNLCVKCAVKRLGYQDEPSSTLPGLLEPWSLLRK
jgi:hypothetical protein